LLTTLSTPKMESLVKRFFNQEAKIAPEVNRFTDESLELITIRSKDKGLRLLKYKNDIRNFNSLKNPELQDIKCFDDEDI
jgi:hypothetical protein